MLAIIIVMTYLNEGFIIYRTGLLKWGIFVQNAVYFSLASNMLFGIFNSVNLVGLVLNTTLTSAVIYNFLYQKIQGRRLELVTGKASLEF